MKNARRTKTKFDSETKASSPEMLLLQIQKKVLNPLGIWPKARRSFRDNLIAFNLFLWVVLHLISSSINVIRCGRQLSCILENMAYTTFPICSIYILVVYLYYQDIYSKAMETLLEMMEKFDSQKYTEEAELATGKFTTFATFYSSYGLFQFIVTPLFDYKYCVKRDSAKSSLDCGLPTPGTFPFDKHSDLGYQIAFVIEVVWSTATVAAGIPPYFVVCTFVYHVIAHLNLLKDNLKEIPKFRAEERMDALKRCVEHQMAIIEFSDALSVPGNALLLVYAVLMAFVFSAVGFQVIAMLTTKIEIFLLIRYLIIFFGWFTLLVVLSFLGQKLIDESTIIADYAYQLPWYEESIEFQKMIKLIILRSNKPLSLKCASVTHASVENFNTVMSTTYSYMMLLYNVVLREEESHQQ